MIDELQILRELLPGLPQNDSVVLGPGDDCAALEIPGGRLLLAAVDQVIGDVHFFADSTPPAAAGAKLMKRNLSDIAAMGGEPRWALLSLAVKGRPAAWIGEFCRGAAEAGQRYGVPVVGGDLAGLREQGIVGSLSILGEVPRGEIVRRSGARPGDTLWVTGCFGNSLASGTHLSFEPRLAEGRFLAANGYADAMLDVSDGLLLDAGRLAAASGVGLELDPDLVPRREGATLEGALSDGEDYELLFAVPGGREAKLVEHWPVTLAPIVRIGRVVAGSGEISDPAGETLTKGRKTGYEH